MYIRFNSMLQIRAQTCCPLSLSLTLIEPLAWKSHMHKAYYLDIFGRLLCSSKQSHCSLSLTHTQMYPQGQFLQTTGRACSQSCSKWLHKLSLAHPRLNMYGAQQLWLCPQSKYVMKHLKATSSNLCKTDNLFSRLFKILQRNSSSPDA